MGQFGEASRTQTFKMVSTLVLLPLLGLASAQLHPAVPGAIPSVGNLEAQQAWILAQQQYVADALAFVAGHGRSRRSLPVPGTLPGVGDIAAQQAWILQQQAHLNLVSQWPALAGRTKRSLPLPGTPEVLSLESNPQAKAEWYWAQQAHQAQLVAHNAQIAALGRKKRSNIVANLPLPGTAAVSALTPEQAAFCYQAQLQQAQNEIAVAGRRKRSNIVASLPVPGSAAISGLTPEQAAFWYQAQLQQAQNEVNALGRKKRSLPLPGTPEVLSLESNPQAKAEWYWAQQAHQAQLAAHNAQIAALGRKKRSNIVANLLLPGTAAVSALTPE